MAEYNGWTNYETWQCALWLDNDQGLAALAAGSGGDADELEDALSAYLTIRMAMPASLLGDIVGAWLREVDYKQIVERHE